jgi:predicted transcriptional regulator
MHVSTLDRNRHLSRLARSSSVQITKAVASIHVRERLRQNVSHETLARLAKVHRSTVSRTESGKMHPTFLGV